MSVRIEGRDVASTANVLAGPFEPPFTHPVEFYDNTLREGEQTPGAVFTPEEKLELARALDDFGVPWANVGFPAVSEEEFQAVASITGAGLEKMKTAALCRMLPSDIDITVKSGVDMLSVFLAASDTHLEHKYQLTEAEAIARIEEWVPYAKSSGKLVAFSIEDASRAPLPRLVRMLQAAEAAGADYLNVADTVGILTPASAYMMARVLTSVLAPPLGLHFHDDLGLALANTLAGLQGGARLAHVTVNGAGERAGNTCLEELAVFFKVKHGMDLGFKLDRLGALSELVHRMCGTEPPAHKSVTGKWAFTHESGIHVAGVLANPETYQAYPPELIGRHHEIVFGKHSGRRGVRYFAELQGIELSDDACQAVVDRIKKHGKAAEQGPIADSLVLEWIRAAAEAR